MRGVDVERRLANVERLGEDALELAVGEHPRCVKPDGEPLDGRLDLLRPAMEVHPRGAPDECGEGEGLLGGEGVEVPVEVLARRLYDTSPVARVGHLVQVELEDLGLAEPRFEPRRFEALEPAGPDGAGTGVEHADHLLGDRARAADGPEGGCVLDDGVEPREPVDAAVLVEALVLGGEKRVDEERRGFVKRDAVVDVPRVLVGDREPLAVPVEIPGLGERGPVRRKSIRCRREPREGGERERRRPGGEASEQEPEAHGARSTTRVPGTACPNTSGSYISSARVGSTWNVPEAIAWAT